MTDPTTLGVYERHADDYRTARAADPDAVARARRFAQAARGVRADLGCGPGIYLSHLGRPVVALDAAHAMLPLARSAAPEAPPVQGLLARLPFASGSLGGVWARASYVHTAYDGLPAALAEAHRVLAVGAPLMFCVVAGEGNFVSDDELPGRRFWRWTEEHLADVVVGAGFVVESLETHRPWIWVEARRARTLADTVAASMRVLVCGLNPSLHAADVGVGYAGPGNRFWPAAVASGLVEVPRDPYAALARGVGMTDLVKRATPRASEVSTAEFRTGVERVRRLVARLEPRAVCFVGLAGYRAALDRRAGVGWHEFEGRPAYVMPSTSGLNARTSLDELVAHFVELQRGADAGEPVAG